MTAKVNVRGGPNTSGRVIGSLSAGTSIEAGESRGNWRRVRLDGQEGWVSSRYLSAQPPSVTTPVREPSRTVARVAAEPDEDDDDSGGVTPIREPYVGTCDCPYDVMRNGRSCGGRSAYSRPGGRKPKCYR
ncbi:SH3 domain-containing protein [Ancylobacter oerskovii]|nr:SH3 domain-containing protein [Ancylobacter oerskovii]